jgi:hypothetical protein
MGGGAYHSGSSLLSAVPDPIVNTELGAAGRLHQLNITGGRMAADRAEIARDILVAMLSKQGGSSLTGTPDKQAQMVGEMYKTIYEAVRKAQE